MRTCSLDILIRVRIYILLFGDVGHCLNGSGICYSWYCVFTVFLFNLSSETTVSPSSLRRHGKTLHAFTLALVVVVLILDLFLPPMIASRKEISRQMVFSHLLNIFLKGQSWLISMAIGMWKGWRKFICPQFGCFKTLFFIISSTFSSFVVSVSFNEHFWGQPSRNISSSKGLWRRSVYRAGLRFCWRKSYHSWEWALLLTKLVVMETTQLAGVALTTRLSHFSFSNDLWLLMMRLLILSFPYSKNL